MNNEAIAIYYEIAGRKKYIATMSFRSDNKILPTYNEDVSSAHQFTNEAHAQEIITRIHNVHDRTFHTETYNAGRPKINSYTHKGKDALV